MNARGLALIAAALAVPPAWGDSGEGEGGAPFKPSGLVELKRQATARGTPEETTKTNLKLDWFPEGGAVALLRLELPFPDAKASFEGSPFDPDFGDAKVRAGLRAVDLLGRPFTSFLELTFPTAKPEEQGTGKYQGSGGIKTAFPLGAGFAAWGSPKRSFSVQVQQVVSFGGDATRKDINQTKFELEWREEWPQRHFAKATAKPVVDWVQDGKTGGVLELEGGWAADRHWTFALMAGGLLWGKGTASTYETRGELKAIYRY